MLQLWKLVLASIFLMIGSHSMHVRTEAALEDNVKNLDGFCDFSKDYEMYSGYLQLQSQPLISVHYVFMTSMRNPTTDDLVLWLNGGPGCSSLLGMALELGPCILNQGAKTFSQQKNPYSWNTNANMLFLENPPGVGFSINNDPSYIYNETRTADDALLAIQKWFDKFPQFKANNFWISGESYCGMYIPYLTSAMIKKDPSIKLKGILIGNGVMVTYRPWRIKARNTFYSRHYFYGPDISRMLSSCKYDGQDANKPACIIGQRYADDTVRQINPYATTGICYAQTKTKFWYTPFEENSPRTNDDFPSCSTDDSGLITYLNQPIVQQQLHVANIAWESCNQAIGNTYKKDNTSINLFESFKAKGLKILLFSGNTDAVVSYVQSEEYIKEIGWKQTSEKRSFANSKGSLMGWNTEYDGLSFTVINGAGHMVPSDKPHAAWVMLDRFIYPK